SSAAEAPASVDSEPVTPGRMLAGLVAPGIADPAAGPAPSTADPEVPRDVSSGITVPGSGRRLVVVIYTSPLDTDFPPKPGRPESKHDFFHSWGVTPGPG